MRPQLGAVPVAARTTCPAPARRPTAACRVAATRPGSRLRSVGEEHDAGEQAASGAAFPASQRRPPPSGRSPRSWLPSLRAQHGRAQRCSPWNVDARHTRRPLPCIARGPGARAAGTPVRLPQPVLFLSWDPWGRPHRMSVRPTAPARAATGARWACRAGLPRRFHPPGTGGEDPSGAGTGGRRPGAERTRLTATHWPAMKGPPQGVIGGLRVRRCEPQGAPEPRRTHVAKAQRSPAERFPVEPEGEARAACGAAPRRPGRSPPTASDRAALLSPGLEPRRGVISRGAPGTRGHSRRDRKASRAPAASQRR